MKPTWENKRYGIKLYQGDCLKVLPTLRLERIGTIITDPPYGETQLAYDVSPATEWCSLLSGWKGVVASFASFRFALKLIDKMPLPFRYEMVWVKNLATRPLDANRRPLCNHEFVLIFGAYRFHRVDWPRGFLNRKIDDVIDNGTTATGKLYGQNLPRVAYRYTANVCPQSAFACPRPGNHKANSRPDHHPSQKPLPIPIWLARTYTPRKSVVLDPFMGSGTTCIACLETGRRFIGIESEKKYFRMSVKRIEAWIAEHAGQKKGIDLLDAPR